MNSIKKTIIASLILSALNTTMLANNGNQTTAEKEIQKHLAITTTSLPKKDNMKVDVVFTTQEDGRVNFVIAKTDNEQLKKEVEDRFSKIVLKTIKPNVCYGITLNLKTL